MAACLRARDAPRALETAVVLYEEAQRKGVADAAVYGAAMQACVLAGWRGQAWSLLETAVKTGTDLTTLELNIALGAGARCGKLREAVALLLEMRREGSRVPPDVGSYDALLQPLAAAGRYDTVLRLFAQMGADGLPPLEHHYRLAIGSCAALGQGERAATLLLRMQESGMAFTRAVGDAMQACNLGGQPEVAIDMFEAVRHETARLPSADHARSPFVYRSALSALRQQGNVEEAVALVLQMGKVDGVAPDAECFHAAFSTCREQDRALLLTSLLPTLAKRCTEESHFLERDALHTELIRCFDALGHTNRCVRLFAQLAAADVPLTPVLLGFTLHALRHGAVAPSLATLRAPIVAIGVERGAYPQPLRWDERGAAVLDLSSHEHAAPLLAVLHYVLAKLSYELPLHPAPPQAIELLTDASGGAYHGKRGSGSAPPLPLDIVRTELQSLRLRHNVEGVEILAAGGSSSQLGRLTLDGAQLQPHIISAVLGTSRALDNSSSALDALHAAIGPATDELDVAIDQLARGFAPRAAWLESARRRALMAQRKAAMRRPEDYSVRTQARSEPSRWPEPRLDGAVPWSTPRRDDTRQRDNVFRARARPRRKGDWYR